MSSSAPAEDGETVEDRVSARPDFNACKFNLT